MIDLIDVVWDLVFVDCELYCGVEVVGVIIYIIGLGCGCIIVVGLGLDVWFVVVDFSGLYYIWGVWCCWVVGCIDWFCGVGWFVGFVGVVVVGI